MQVGKVFYFYMKLTLKSLETLGVSDFGQYTVNTLCFQYLIYLAKRRNSWLNKPGLPDGLPVPSPRLLFLVTNSFNKELFYDIGALGAECIRRILKKNKVDINTFGSILDFGCGCERILRHWKTLNGPKIYGSDYNPSLADWRQKSLPFAEVKQNKLSGELDYENEKFDFIYAISVFTHLSEDLQYFWINELTRVLKPGGYLLMSVHATTCTFIGRPPWVRQKFESGQLVVLESERAGTNFCNAYHPEAYIRKWLGQKYIFVDFVPRGARDTNQDVCLLMKRTENDQRKGL
jgi:SAM-dependent methyltransferase